MPPGILAPRLCAIASDAIVVATTWRNTYQAARLRLSNGTDSMDYALSWYLIRDGKLDRQAPFTYGLAS